MNRHTHTLVLILLGAALLGRPTSVTAQTALLEVDVGEEGEVKLMQVNDDGGFVVRGIDNGAIPASGGGARLMWYPGKAAFRAGRASSTTWDDANVGRASVAMGSQTMASGDGATALGALTVASNLASTAMGALSAASGAQSTAMGSRTRASGPVSTAMGEATTAGGEASTAMGRETQALGANSTAMGFRTIAHGVRSTVMGSDASTLPAAVGSFVYGDASTDAVLVSSGPNEFAVRAAGGFRFRTEAGLGTGCNLPPGSGTFACTSSRVAKEGFEHLDGEAVLGKLAAIPIQRWRYRGTDALHVGPTAEDFHAAFQLGQGPTTISTVDADGISLLAVQALERRTAELRQENAELRAELEVLRRMVETGRAAP